MTKYNLWCIENGIKSPEFFIEDINIVAKLNPEFIEIANYINKLNSEEYELRHDIQDINIFQQHMVMVYNAILLRIYELIYIYCNMDSIDTEKLEDMDYLVNYSFELYKKNFNNFIHIVKECKDSIIYLDILKEIKKNKYNNTTQTSVILPEIPLELRGE